MKILVATDYSENSKSAIEFAIQLAEQNNNIELSFFHSLHVGHPFELNDEDFEIMEKNKEQEDEQVLKTFVDNIYKSIQIVPKKHEYIIKESVVPHGNIINYAEKESFDYICVGARGASKIEKYLGTNTVNIINKTTIPVFAIPSTYQSQKIDKVLYASDFSDLDKELKTVLDFTSDLNTVVEVLHFAFPSEADQRIKDAENLKAKYNKEQIKFTVIPNNALKPVISNIKNYVKDNKPSLLIMFTVQHKSFFEKFLFAGNTESIALRATVPLLVYKK